MATRLQRGSAYTSPLDPFSPAPHYSDFASSSFQTAEYIEALCRRDPSDVERIAGLPTSNTEQQGEGRQLVEPEVWVFEHLR